jgi:Icc-related predicted phosphoesterase
LWSHIPYSQSKDVQTFIGDYRQIHSFSIHASNNLHTKAIDYIRSEIENASKKGNQLIVVTHHAPLTTGTSHSRHQHCPLNCAFASDLQDLLCPPVRVWVHGHTHYSHTTTLSNGTLVVANQRGYEVPQERDMFNIESKFIVHFETPETATHEVDINKSLIIN